MLMYPVILEHAAAFIERSPWEVSRDADLLYRAHSAAWAYYRHAPVVCGIDVYHLDVESWGAKVERPDGNTVPSLGPPVCSKLGELRKLPELDVHRSGRLPLTLAAALRLKAAGADGIGRFTLSKVGQRLERDPR